MKEHHKNVIILIIIFTIIAIVLSLLSHGDEPGNHELQLLLPLLPLLERK